MAPGSPNDLNGVSDLFGNLFDSSSLDAPVDDGFLRSAFAQPPTSAKEKAIFPRNSHQIRECYQSLNLEDDFEAMGITPPEFRSYFDQPNSYTIPDDGLFDDGLFDAFIDWDPEQSCSYTLAQALSTSLSAGEQPNRIASEPQNISGGCHRKIPNEISSQLPQLSNACQSTTLSLNQEAIAARQTSTSLMGKHNVPRSMPTYCGTATRSTSPSELAYVSIRGDESYSSGDLDAYVRSMTELASNFEQPSQMPIFNTDSYVNHLSMTPVDITPSPSNIATTSCGSSPSSTSQLVQTPQSTASSSKRSHDSFIDSPTELLLHFEHRKKQHILPAPMKVYPGAPQTSQNLLHTTLQPFYGPERAPSKRSDRRRFTDEEKKLIRDVRKEGACFCCMANKSQCDTNKICKGCQKKASAKPIKLDASRICIREGILEYRKQFSDFYDTKGRLNLLPKTLRQPRRELIIGDRVTLNDIDNAFFPQKIALTVSVREYGACTNDTRLMFSEGSTRSALKFYAIDRSTFPTVQQLDDWGRNLLFEETLLPGFRPYIMDKFLFAYLHAEPALPHHDLVDSTIRLVSLSTWLFEVHPVTAAENIEKSNSSLFDYHDERVERRLAEVARSQLLLIALTEHEGFETTEKKIFSKIDALLRRTGGCNPQSALIVSLCLRRISLLYRFSMMRYRKFAIDLVIRSKIDKSKAMYELLSTAYSNTYRGANSPYNTKKWKLEDHTGAFGHDKDLSDMFLEVVEYEKQYCENYLDDEYDAHFKQLFFKRGEGGGPPK